MSVTEKYDSLKFRIMTIERLRLLKRIYSYRELAKITGIPETVLCRYVKGAVIPSLDQASKIWNALDELLDVKSLIRRSMEVTKDGIVDISQVYSNPLAIELIAHKVYSLFAGKRITKVLTPSLDGAIFSTAIAIKFQVPLIIAKTSKDVTTNEYYEKMVYIPPTSMMTFYVPKSMLKRKDEVLIVESVLRSGRVLQALID